MTREGAGAEDYSDRLRVHILNRISQRFGGTVKAAATEIVQSFDMLIPLYIRAASAAATAKERVRIIDIIENEEGWDWKWDIDRDRPTQICGPVNQEETIAAIVAVIRGDK